MVTLFLTMQRLRRNTRGQDLIEYALLAGVVSLTAGAFLPQWVAPQISAIFSRVVSVMSNSNSFGS